MIRAMSLPSTTPVERVARTTQAVEPPLSGNLSTGSLETEERDEQMMPGLASLKQRICVRRDRVRKLLRRSLGVCRTQPSNNAAGLSVIQIHASSQEGPRTCRENFTRVAFVDRGTRVRTHIGALERHLMNTKNHNGLAA